VITYPCDSAAKEKIYKKVNDQINMLKKTKILFLFLIISIIIFSQENYYSPGNIYRFAEYLYNEREFLRAAGEYQRLLILPDSTLSADLLMYKIANCYQLACKYEMSSRYFQKIIDDYQVTNYREKSYPQIAYNYLKSGFYDQSIHFIQENINNSSLKITQLKMKIIQGINYFYQRKWRISYDHFLSLKPENSAEQDSLSLKYFSYLDTFAQLAKEACQFPYKNKLFAGMVSTIIPGSGKVYAGRSKDGLYSFILIGICGWQSYDGFSKKGVHSLKGWIYGSLGAFFYVGNIYGSIVAVKIYNEKIEEQFIKKVELNFTWE
jgi:tetratricopeptide (TPR) repeat protein